MCSAVPHGKEALYWEWGVKPACHHGDRIALSTNSTSAIHLYVSALRHTLYKCNVIPVVVASWHGPACLDARRCHPPPIVAQSLPYNTLTHEDTCTLAGGLVSEGRAAPTYPPSLMILYPSAFSASAKAWRGENGSAVAGCGT